MLSGSACTCIGYACILGASARGASRKSRRAGAQSWRRSAIRVTAGAKRGRGKGARVLSVEKAGRRRGQGAIAGAPSCSKQRRREGGWQAAECAPLHRRGTATWERAALRRTPRRLLCNDVRDVSHIDESLTHPAQVSGRRGSVTPREAMCPAGREKSPVRAGKSGVRAGKSGRPRSQIGRPRSQIERSRRIVE